MGNKKPPREDGEKMIGLCLVIIAVVVVPVALIGLVVVMLLEKIDKW